MSKKILRILGISTLSTAAVSVILRFLGISFFYDTTIGYYHSNAIVPFIAQLLPLVFTACLAVVLIIPSLRPAPCEASNHHPLNILAIFPAAGFTAYTVSYFIAIYEAMQFGLTLSLLDIVSVIATVCSAAFFWIIFAGKTGSLLYVATGTALIIRMVFMLAQCYFDTQVQMNAPNKTVFMFAVLSVMLLVVNELRIGETVKKPLFHLFSASVAVIFTTVSAIPSIIGYFSGNMPLNYNIVFYDITLLFFAVFAVARLCQLCFGCKCDNIADPTPSVDDDTIPTEE